DAAEISALNQPRVPEVIYGVAGCESCRFTGYSGRTGIYELMVLDDHLRRMIHDNAGEQELRDYAARHGMMGLREDGMRWVAAGETSLEEVLRVTKAELNGQG
ncbi:MAG: type II secretion system protein GspE, partial [Pyrinomonadaceae bacterium]